MLSGRMFFSSMPHQAAPISGEYPVDANTVALLHMNGTQGSTTFTDSTGNGTWTTQLGTPYIDTVTYRLGNGSCALSNGDVSNTTTTSIYDWSQTDYTVEAWVNMSSFTQTTASQPTMFGNMSLTTTLNYWSFGPISTGAITFYYYTGASVYVTSTTLLSLSTWHHIAAVHSGGNILLFIDGVLDSTTAVSGTPQFSTSLPMSLGYYRSTYFDGHIDEFRLSNVARWTSNFTPA